MVSKTIGVDTTVYAYDQENRLIGVTAPTETISYAYDADGIRIAKSVDGVRTDFLVDKNRPYAQVLGEYDDAGGLVVSYVYGDDLISQNRSSVASFYHYDGQLSTRLLTDASENVTDSYAYDAFGSLTSRTGATENSYLYTGEQYDPNIGFYYLRARYYSPEIGRFITTDPWKGSVFEPVSLHKYLYAKANPVMYSDPSGKMSIMDTSFAQSISSILRSSQLQIYNALGLIGPAFKISARAGGAALNRLGMVVQNVVANILSQMGASIQAGIRVTGPGGNRVLDLLARVGDRIAWIEVKYQLPSKAGKALDRLVGQMKSGLSSADGAQVVIFTFKEPAVKSLEFVMKSLGETQGSIQFVHGLRGLVQWFNFYF